MIIATADAGGSKTTVAVTRSAELLEQLRGPGAAVRPGRALASATTIVDLIRSGLARARLLRADTIVVGAAGAGREADAEELRAALSRERLATRVVVVSDVALAYAALALDVGVVLVAGTGSVAYGQTPGGNPVRRGGFGWQMGDEAGGYWIGRRALQAVGLAEDGRGPATELRAGLLKAVGSSAFRDVVGWSTVASPREVASLCNAVVHAAEEGDGVATAILDDAVAGLAALVNDLGRDFPAGLDVPVGMAGGLVGLDGPLGERVRSAINPPFRPLKAPLDPLAGGPLLAARPV